MKKILIFIILLSPIICYSQVNDNFEDGNILGWTESTSGRWHASNASPINGSSTLHHIYDNSSGDHDQISHSFGLIDITAGIVTWQFQVKHGFNPSGSNNWGFFLYADQDASEMYPQTGGDASGYILGVNYNGESDDLIGLWEKAGASDSRILNTNSNWQSEVGSSQAVGFQVTRSTSGEWTIYWDKDGGFDNLTQMCSSVTNTNQTTANHLGIYYEYSLTQDMQLWIDDISCTGTLGANSDSQVSAGASTEPGSISSLIDSQGEALNVIDVTFTDLASGDSEPTIIDQLRFTKGTNNDISDWTNAIAGAELTGTDITGAMSGSITAEGITFSGNDFISIADGGNETYFLRIWLNTDLSNISDNNILDFKLSYNDITCDASGSSFGSGEPESGAITTQITATDLNFTNVPVSVMINTDFSLTVSATDVNGNTDEDYTSLITISKSTGSGSVSSSSGLNQNANTGTRTWSDLQYNASGNFTLAASSGSLNSATTSNIQSENLIIYIDEGFEGGNLNYWINTDDWAHSATDQINGTRSLKHNLSGVTGNSYINYPLGGIPVNTGTTTWRFNLKNGNWDPSGTNNFGVYLFADQTDFTSNNINGYIVGVDIEGSSDLLTLWRISNGSATAVINSSFNWDTEETVGIEVTRGLDGNWTLKYDINGNFDNLVTAGNQIDNTFTDALYFGGLFNFGTASRAGELWIDSVYISGPQEKISPKITNILALSQNTLRITFDEALEQATAEIEANFTCNNSIANPQTSTLIAESYNQVELTFTESFSEGTNYNLTIENINDLHSNIIADTIVSFSYSDIVIERISASSANTVDVYFSKDLNTASAEIETNYSVDKTIGNPSAAVIDGSNSKLVHLTFTENLILEEEYTISVTNIEDSYNNAISDTNVVFIYYEPEAFDIIVNEIMCDINPVPEAVPPYKYIEIYNNSEYNLYLKDWTIQIGDNTAKVFPDSVINSGEYIIICEEDAEPEMSDYGTVIPILNTSELTQSGKRIVVRDSTDEIIEDITYSDDWYDDTEKDNGGWSLERIDPTNFCSENDNWTAANDYTGGTPGRENSVFATFNDTVLPTILNIEYISSKQINIHFSEKVLRDSAEIMTNYTLNESINPTAAVVDSESSSVIHLQFANNFQIGENAINIQNIPDNCENMMTEFVDTFIYTLIYPELIEVMSENQLRITFSEQIEQTTAESLTNYFVNNSIENPDIATISNTNNRVINLHFPVDFIHAEYYTVSIENIEDINSNSMDSTGLDFSLYTPKEFDVVFTEIMCDVSPLPEGLPGTEYLEIYNTSAYDINLNNWSFVTGNTTERIFPGIVIEPEEYLIICHEDYVSEFEEYGKVAGILGGSDLSISGKNLKLYTAGNNLIADINYTKDWYNDEDNNNGGISIERIDLTNFCGNEDNWAASVDIRGGTPCELNSVNAANPDNNAPGIDSVSVISSNHLKLFFDETVSYESGNNEDNYSVDNSVGIPSSAKLDTLNRHNVSLIFDNQFSSGETHTVFFNNISDNCGNILSSTGYEFVYTLIHTVNIWVYNKTQIIINFSETVDLTTGTALTNYSADNGLGNPVNITRWQTDSSYICLEFASEFVNGQVVTLNLSGIEDVNGNRINPTALEFTYYIPQANDIIINEVLFNPKSGGSDFVEIYNRSDYKIDMLHFFIATKDENGEIKSKSRLSASFNYINPNEYKAFTKGRYEVLRDYMSRNQEGVIEIDDFPSYSDDEGTVLILYEDSIIDEFAYTDDMHFELLNDDNGVSLERISFDNPTQDASNWHSASEFSGYATPAYENSQHNEDIENVADEITIEPKQFSPNNDGIDDVANIFYSFDSEGYIATVYVLNADGQTIKILANNKLLGIEGSITWDGLDRNNSRARSGIYLIYFKVFDKEGNVKSYKKTVVLAAKF